MTKRIACLATLRGGIQESDYSKLVLNLFDSARIFNKENNICGAFLVRDNVILQILEGQSNALAKMMYRISRDPSISPVSVILNTVIDKPLFSRWSMKMLNEDLSHHQKFLDDLNNIIRSDIKITTTADKYNYSLIFDYRATQQATAKIPGHAVTTATRTASLDFSNKRLSMKSWPSPTKLRLTASLMKLSSILIGHQTEYDRLVDLKIFETEEELKQTLALLESAGALTVKNKDRMQNITEFTSTETVPKETKSSHRFSTALKKFIGAQRTRGLN